MFFLPPRREVTLARDPLDVFRAFFAIVARRAATKRKAQLRAAAPRPHLREVA